jgi:hypothetical protein
MTVHLPLLKLYTRHSRLEPFIYLVFDTIKLKVWGGGGALADQS